MKNVYLIGSIIVCFGLVYWGAYTKGRSNEKSACAESKIAMVEKIETERQAVATIVDSSSDDDVMRMLCEKYARGGCVWPDNLSGTMRDTRSVPGDIGNKAPDIGK